MIVRNDVAILGDEEARPKRATLARFRFFFLFLTALFHELIQARHAAKLFEEFLHVSHTADFALGGDVDADHGRLNLFDQIGKTERRAPWRFNLDRLGTRLRAEDLWGEGERAYHRHAHQRSYHGLSRYADCLHSCLQVTEKFACIGHVGQHKPATSIVVIKRQ